MKHRMANLLFLFLSIPPPVFANEWNLKQCQTQLEARKEIYIAINKWGGTSMDKSFVHALSSSAQELLNHDATGLTVDLAETSYRQDHNRCHLLYPDQIASWSDQLLKEAVQDLQQTKSIDGHSNRSFQGTRNTGPPWPKSFLPENLLGEDSSKIDSSKKDSTKGTP